VQARCFTLIDFFLNAAINQGLIVPSIKPNIGIHATIVTTFTQEQLPMANPPRDPEREERITMEIVVDAYGPEEQAMGWYYYLQDILQFPFTATCILKRPISPLKTGAIVEVVDMAPEDECEQEMFVTIDWKGDTLAVPLIQLEAPTADAETQQAIADWHYWVNQGYEFG
jgi:Calcium binding